MSAASPLFAIRPVRSKEDLSAAIALIKTYTGGLGIDLSYQDFEAEMACMPGSYAPPFGEFLIAVANQQEKESSQTPDVTPQTLGCIALRELHLQGHGDIHGRVPVQPSVQEGKAARVTSQLHAGPVGEADDGKAPGPTTRKPDTKYCELKRLYVTPAARGLGVGKALVNSMLTVAHRIGYEEVRLDTLSEMREAIALYKGLGFGAVEKYYERAIEGTVFLGLKL
ncbi:GNAT family acetyltransferase [Histoplasma ohiense]|nr:GNAT family acetyltransferase [Histoplasma ohiense (nom. inval.)]